MKKSRRELIYSPKKDATPDEIMQILKVFAYTTQPPSIRSHEGLISIYESLPEGAKRHFRIKEIK